MPRRKQGARVNGPYPHHRRWRIVYWDLEGERHTESFETRQDAEDFAATLRAGLEAPDISELIVKYREFQRDKGNAAKSISVTEDRIVNLIGSMDVRTLTIKGLKQRYRERTRELVRKREHMVSAASHRQELSACKTFLRWCVLEEGIKLRFELHRLHEIKPMGKVKRGDQSKKQLRPSEAVRFVQHALSIVEQDTRGSEAALAVLTVFYLGARPKEVMALESRDVDGALLFIDGTKTRSAVRRNRISDSLGRYRAALATQAMRRRGQKLFWFKGEQTLNRACKRLCRQAKLDLEVCVYSLRGLHASFARQEGVTSDAVARQLGHSSVEMHERAYASKASVAAGRALRVVQAVGGE